MQSEVYDMDYIWINLAEAKCMLTFCFEQNDHPHISVSIVMNRTESARIRGCNVLFEVSMLKQPPFLISLEILTKPFTFTIFRIGRDLDSAAHPRQHFPKVNLKTSEVVVSCMPRPHCSCNSPAYMWNWNILWHSILINPSQTEFTDYVSFGSIYASSIDRVLFFLELIGTVNCSFLYNNYVRWDW